MAPITPTRRRAISVPMRRFVAHQFVRALPPVPADGPASPESAPSAAPNLLRAGAPRSEPDPFLPVRPGTPDVGRVGKIARLPRAIRDELNRQLLDGASSLQLIPWLNGQPEVQAILVRWFGGRAINRQNLSSWRRGGYLYWLAQRHTPQQLLQSSEGN